MPDHRGSVLGVILASVLSVASLARALPIELKDSNGTKYNISTQVVPQTSLSNASGAVANATFTEPVTVTSYYIGITPWFGFITTYTVQRQVNIPLRPAFDGFNSLLIAGINGQRLSVPLVYNPGQPVASQDCPDSNGKNKELVFQSQTFAEQGLTLTRKVFVSSNKPYLRWLNIVTNTGSSPITPAIVLLGLLDSGAQTKIVATSSGDSTLTIGDLWFTSAQSVPQGTTSTEPRIGFVVQGNGAATPVSNLGISTTSTPPGKAAFSYQPTIQPGGTVIVMTFTTVQGQNKAAKNQCENIVANPLPSDAIKCMSEQELSQVVNFAHITPPTLKKATVSLNFKKTGVDTVQWKGKITIGADITLTGLPVNVDFGGFTQAFVLNKGGSANNGNGNKFNLNASLKNGVTKAGTYNFSFNLKGDLQTPLAQYGLTNAAADNLAVSIPVTLTAGPGEYAVDQPFTYNAKPGKSGTAKAS